SLALNKEGNIEYNADIQSPEDLETTAEGYGTTYRKILCAAFDLSLLMTYSDSSFFRFVYHDGLLEALDDRKKIELIELVKKISAQHNLQYILTVIDSDLPRDDRNQLIRFSESEIALRLHDRDDSGKLFEMSF
ncbi:MAG TPA: DUF2326 domain-containing protein, partial [bacterium]|nr:DUF2326 domain-containing protein [bacterium]